MFRRTSAQRQHRIVESLLLAALAGLVLFPPATASATDGFILGLDLHTSHIGADDPSPDSPDGSVFVDETGGGVTLLIGYGITESFPLRFTISASAHETTDPDVDFLYSSATLEGGYLFRNGEPFRPFVSGGFGAFAIESRQDDLSFETTGPGAVIGAGFYYFFNENFALDFGVRGEFINWEQTTATLTLPGGSDLTVETPVEDEGSAAKFLFGASYWF